MGVEGSACTREAEGPRAGRRLFSANEGADESFLPQSGATGPSGHGDPGPVLEAEQGHPAFPDVPPLVKRDGAGDAIETNRLEGRQVAGRIRRAGRFDGLDQRIGCVVAVGRVELHVHVEALLEAGEEGLAPGHLGLGQPALGAIGALFQGGPGELEHFGGAGAVTPQELGVHAELAHLAQERTALGVHAAVEQRLRLAGLHPGEDGHEIRSLVVREFPPHHFDAELAPGLGKGVGEPLAVGGAVVDDRHLAQFEGVRRVARHGRALLEIVGDHPETGAVALLGELGAGGRGGDVGNPGLVVNAGGWNRRARGYVTHHAPHPQIHQALGHRGGGAGVGLVVFRHQFETDLLAAQGEAGGVGVLQGEAGAILLVLAQVGDGAGKRAGKADLHHHFGPGAPRHEQAGQGEGAHHPGALHCRLLVLVMVRRPMQAPAKGPILCAPPPLFSPLP